FIMLLCPQKNFDPRDAPLPAISTLDSSIKNQPRGAPNIPPRAVAFDERHNRVRRHNKLSVYVVDRLPVGRNRNTVIGGLHVFSVLSVHRIKRMLLAVTPQLTSEYGAQ